MHWIFLKGVHSTSSTPSIDTEQPEFIGNALVDVFTKFRKSYGGIYCIYPFIGFQCIVISDAKMIKHVLSSGKAKNYVKSQSAYSNFAPLLGGGLVVLEGISWKLHRSLISPLFRFDSLQHHAFTIFTKIIQSTKQQLLQQLNLQDNKMTIDTMELFRELTLKIIAEATFGWSDQEEERAKQLMDIYSFIIAEINLRVWYPHRKYLPTKTKRQYDAKVNALDTMILAIIQQKRQSELSNNCLLDLMLQSQDSETGQTLSDQDILCEVKTFMLAGHETSSMWLSYTLHCLVEPCHKSIYDKVQEECEQVMHDCNDTITYAQLSELRYTTNVLKETLRLYPIVPLIVKTAVEEDEIDGYRIPAGSHIALDIWNAHHDPEYWGKDSRCFVPERFEDSRHHPFSFLPFGLGPRNCLGQNFAYMEAKIVLAIFMTTFQFEKKDSTEGFLPMDRFDIPLHPRKAEMPVIIKT